MSNVPIAGQPSLSPKAIGVRLSDCIFVQSFWSSSWKVPWSTVFIFTVMPVASVNALLISSMPVFSPGSEWLLPTDRAPTAPTEAPAEPDGAEGAAPVAVGALGALDAPGPHAARSDGVAARPATPARPARTRRRVSIGLPGDGDGVVAELGVSRFATVSSLACSLAGTLCAYEQTPTGSHGLSDATPPDVKMRARFVVRSR